MCDGPRWGRKPGAETHAVGNRERALIRAQPPADRHDVETDQLERQTSAGATPAGENSGPPAGCDASSPADDAANRRAGDRRERPTSFWSSLRGPRRREDGRRTGENENTYVDRYRRSDIVLLGAIFGLNIADALFTLIWLQKGGSEGNPVMDWFLEQGDWAFLLQKCLVVGLWLVVLVVHKNFQLARYGLWFLLALYASIFVYHIFLQTMAIPLPGPA
jgi:hypothetical protein